MSTYNINIQYPIFVNGDDITLFAHQQNGEVAERFESFKWWEYRSLQLKLSGVRTVFSVTCQQTGNKVYFTVLDQSNSGQVEVRMDTNFAILTPRRELFGLVTLKVKQNISFERLTLNQARTYLHLFLTDKIEAIEAEYKNVSKKLASAA